jgi:hypothetical protein
MQTRRGFFTHGRRTDGQALASLLAEDLGATQGLYDLTPKKPHHTPRAKSVIQLFMNGGPSQVDLFDTSRRYRNTPGSRPAAIWRRRCGRYGTRAADAAPFQFSKHGQSGIELSEMLPHLAKVVDNICVVRSMFTTHLAHEAALFLMHGGRILPTRPSLGSWITYGLGSENQNLPAYVVLDDPKGPRSTSFKTGNPAGCRPFIRGLARSEGSPILNLQPKQEYPGEHRRYEPQLLHRMDSAHRTGIRATPSSKRASQLASWRRGCKWKPPMRSISRRKAMR